MERTSKAMGFTSMEHFHQFHMSSSKGIEWVRTPVKEYWQPIICEPTQSTKVRLGHICMHHLSPAFRVGDKKKKLTSAFHIDVNLPHTPWTTLLSSPSGLTKLQLPASLPPNSTLHAPELYNIPLMSHMSINIPVPPPENSIHFATVQLNIQNLKQESCIHINIIPLQPSNSKSL